MDHRFLNNDAVTEILLHLPVRSLFRFRAVSKFWCHIIDSSAFRKLHVQNQLNNDNNDSDDNTAVFLQFIKGERYLWELSIMLLDNGKSYKDFPSFHEFFKENIKSRSIRVVGPVNGLICIHNKDSYAMDQASWCVPTAVCNPSLGKIRILPISTQRNSWNSNKDTLFTRATGFGFDYVTKDYKVVQLSSSYKLPWFSDGRRLRVYVEVYTGAAGTWRELATDTLDQNLFITKRIKSSSSYKNGSFAHWRGRRRVRIGLFEDIILSFDMHNEVFETIVIPDYENRGEDEIKSKLFARNDSFLLFVYPRNCNFTRGDKWLNLYELKSEGNKRRWIHVSDFGPFLVVPRPMALWKSDGVVLRYFCKKNKLIFYDNCTQTVRYFEMPDNERRFKIPEYRGRLISP